MTDGNGRFHHHAGGFDSNAAGGFVGGEDTHDGFVDLSKVDALATGEVRTDGPVFDVLHRTNGGGLNGERVSKSGSLGSVACHFDSIFDAVRQPGCGVPVGVVFKIRKVRIEEHPYAAHDGDDHGQQHDHAQHLTDRSFIVATTMDSRSGGASVHRLYTTPYHLGIHL